jgi:hypothetical protein
MANPTTNYGFVLPTPTDLVTDLPADFDVALQGVDTRLKALQPGTTLGDLAYSSATANTNTRLGIGTAGQVLAVSGGVPAWITTSDVTPLTTKGDLFTFTTVDARIGVGANETRLVADSVEATGLKYVADTTNYAIAAKADLLVGTAADTLAALTVGTNGQVLTADSTVSPTGLKWATPAAGSTFSGVGVSNTTDLSTSTGTWTSITFNTELFDTDAYHSTATNTSRITIPAGKSGYFLVTIVGLFEGTNATGTRDLAIAKNGTRVLESVTNKATGSNQSCAASIVMSLVATDYIEFQVRQSSGTTVPWYGTGSSGGTSYTVTYLGA